MSGHEHSYERFDAGGFPFFVNGLGGRSPRGFDHLGTLPQSVVSVTRYNDDYEAMLVEASDSGITLRFYNVNSELIDELTVNKYCGVFENPSDLIYLPTISNTK